MKKQMLINSPLYGKAAITEPVLLELINSPALQRLKHIEQHGSWQFHSSYHYTFSRYQHSVGVMLLLRKFKASLEEQIHGLLHDISHTAFSHVSDFVFDTGLKKSTYHDAKIEKAYELQGINKILKKYGFSPEYILEEKNFPLAERELPDLCADRIDYTLQDPWGRDLSKLSPKKILSQLIVHNKRFVFKNKKSAKDFAELNFLLNSNVWCTPLHVTIYELSAKAIKRALNQKIITKKDLYQTDEQVTKKLKNSKDKIVIQTLNQIYNLKVTTVDRKEADFISNSKTRIVNPYFFANGKLKRLKSVDVSYKRKTENWERKAKLGFPIKIIS